MNFCRILRLFGISWYKNQNTLRNKVIYKRLDANNFAEQRDASDSGEATEVRRRYVKAQNIFASVVSTIKNTEISNSSKLQILVQNINPNDSAKVYEQVSFICNGQNLSSKSKSAALKKMSKSKVGGSTSIYSSDEMVHYAFIAPIKFTYKKTESLLYALFIYSIDDIDSHSQTQEPEQYSVIKSRVPRFFDVSERDQYNFVIQDEDF